jgi:hypothetical protein
MKDGTESSSNNPAEPQREIFQLGPVTIERIGRVVSFRSSWDKDEHQKFLQDIRENRPNLKQQINEEIQLIRTILTEYDSLQILTDISMRNLTGDPEEYREITHEGSEAKVELLMSIATAIPLASTPKSTDSEIIDQVSKLLDQIIEHTFWYYGTEIAKNKLTSTEREIRQRLLNKALRVRGDAYWVHIRETFLELCPLNNRFLLENFGFTAEQLLDTLEYAEECLHERLGHTIEAAEKLQQVHSDFVHWSADKDVESLDIEKLIDAFRVADPIDSDKLEEAMGVFSELGGPAILEVVPRNDVDRTILMDIACECGDNHGFFDDMPESPGWPLNPSLIYEKPVVHHEGHFYTFHLPMALRSATYLLERLIESKDSSYFNSKYLSKRDEYLERRSLGLLAKIMPGSAVFPKMHYPLVVNDHEQWFETDGLILLDSALFIVEAKAGKLTNSARRGSILRLKDNLKDILGKAHEQGLRTLRYIKSLDKVAFYDNKHNQQLSIEKHAFTDIFIIAVSYEQLDFLSAQLSSVKEMGVLKGSQWPWAVYINDLKVIAEINNHSTQFIHYLKKRIPLNDQAIFKFTDETDIFMLYLEEGLYMDKKDFPEYTEINWTGYTEELDSYYLYKEGLRSEVPKPRQQMPGTFEWLLTALEKSMPLGFVNASVSLLDCSERTRGDIAGHIERMEKEFAQDGRSHSASLTFDESSWALLLACVAGELNSPSLDRWARSYITDKGFNRAIVIVWKFPILNGEIALRTATVR